MQGAIIKGFLRNKLPYGLFIKIEILYGKYLKSFKKDEKYCHMAYFHSKNQKAKEKYCIFRGCKPGYGLFAAGLQYIFAYEFAKSKGYIPLLDLEYTYDFQQYNLGKENDWEYCFDQPITVKEALEKDYVLVEDTTIAWLDKTCIDINGKKGEHYIHMRKKDWRKYYANVNKYIKKCWLFKQEFLNEYTRKCGYEIQKKDRVLGVSLRERFSKDLYSKMKKATIEIYNDHPMNPGIQEVLKIVKEHVKKWNCNKIFLATAYRESLEIFQSEFGDNILYLERERESFEDVATQPDFWAMSDKEICEYSTNRLDVTRNMVISYAEEVLGLSNCDYLIAAVSSGSIAALSLNGGKYKDIYILPDKNKITRY